MRLKLKKNTRNNQSARIRKKVRLRAKITGTTERPRLCVFKSDKHIYAQLVDDLEKKTIASASSLKLDTNGKKGIDLAKLVGEEIAKRANKKNINTVVFDRAGYIYHGKVKALADAARENGLKF